jgi:hypothetical protein
MKDSQADGEPKDEDKDNEGVYHVLRRRVIFKD